MIGFSTPLKDAFIERLSKNSQYENVLENFNQENNNLSKNNQFYIPNVSFSSNYSTSNGSQTYINGFEFNVNFFEINGITLGINFPFVINMGTENIIEADNINLLLSLNDLFEDNAAEDYLIEASYLDALHSLNTKKFALLKELLEDIVNYHFYYREKLLSEEYLNLLINEKESEVDEEEMTTITNQILETRIQILNYEKNILNLQLENYFDDLYQEALSFLEEIINLQKEINYESRLDLIAQDLRKNAELLINRFWYEPYLPDFSVLFGIDDFKDFSWNIGFQFSFDIFNKDIKQEVENRKSNYEKLKYEELKNNLYISYRSDLIDIESTEISVQIAEISMEESQINYEKTNTLFDSGFLSQIDFEKEQINYNMNLLTLQKEKENYFLEMFDLLQYTNIILNIENVINLDL